MERKLREEGGQGRGRGEREGRGGAAENEQRRRKKKINHCRTKYPVPMPMMTPRAKSLPTQARITTEGEGSPARPALMNPEPLSRTITFPSALSSMREKEEMTDGQGRGVT